MPLSKAQASRREKDYQFWVGFYSEELQQMWDLYSKYGNDIDPQDFAYCVYLCTAPRFDRRESRWVRPRE